MATVQTFLIAFAVVAGTLAGVLSLLTWDVFRRSAFGRGVFFLTFVMSLFILYHAVLFVPITGSLYANVFESLIYTGFVIVIWVIALTHPARKTERS